jgi:uncharacterized protein
MLHKVIIQGIVTDPETDTPIVTLKHEESEQIIPIWIGIPEATAIACLIKKVKYDRPMIHNLFKNFAQAVNADVTRVELCDIKEDTYYASIQFLSGQGVFSIDARASDAIAIALEFDAPVFVDDKVIEYFQPKDKEVYIMDKSEHGKKWAEHLQKLSQDDFGKYKI